MSYTIIDIVDKTINIEEKRIAVINEMINENKSLPTINILGKVFQKESIKMIDYYKNIKSQLVNSEVEEIYFRTYYNISFLINEFCNKIFVPKAKTPKEYLRYNLTTISDELALFIDIQGRLVNNAHKTSGVTYNILSGIILRMKERIENINKIL